MNIILIGNLGHSFNEVSDEIHMKNILLAKGHNVYAYNSYDIDLLIKKEEWTNEYGTTFKMPTEDIDLFISFKGGIRTLEHWVKLNQVFNIDKFLYWCPDLMENCGNLPRNPVEFESIHLDLAQHADYYFSKELGWKIEYQKAGVNFVYFPTNLAPSNIYNKNLTRKNDEYFYHLNGLDEKVYPVVFTGTFTDIGENRPIFLKKLDEKFDDFHIFSYNPDCFKERGFKNTHGGIWDDNYKYLIDRGLIHLALDWRTDVEGYWSDRIDQIQMCGGFVLSKYTKGMEREFGADKDGIVYWSNLDDLMGKISYYLTNPIERINIADRGYERAVKYHSAETRIDEMLTIVKYGGRD